MGVCPVRMSANILNGNGIIQTETLPEFERAMIRERVLAGLARARKDGTQLGRKRLEQTDPQKTARILSMRAKGTGVRRIASELGVGVGTMLRVVGQPQGGVRP
jgi:DNA invertase Pin-like site-specific DNA recombinase